MIFKQIQEIIEGDKTQTRRIVKAGEEAIFDDNHNLQQVNTPSGRKKWRVGQEYAVVSGRAKQQVFYRYVGGKLEIAHQTLFANVTESLTWYEQSKLHEAHYTDREIEFQTWKQWLELCQFKPLSIRLTDIRIEALQDISESDAIAEGIIYDRYKRMYRYYGTGENWCYTPKVSYQTLWESIHSTHKGKYRHNPINGWDANPTVWVLGFEVVK